MVTFIMTLSEPSAIFQGFNDRHSRAGLSATAELLVCKINVVCLSSAVVFYFFIYLFFHYKRSIKLNNKIKISLFSTSYCCAVLEMLLRLRATRGARKRS